MYLLPSVTLSPLQSLYVKVGLLFILFSVLVSWLAALLENRDARGQVSQARTLHSRVPRVSQPATACH